MSITSSKSRSSLTPIEDTEIDSLNFMNDFKVTPLNGPGAHSETRNPVTFHDNIATKRGDMSDGSDERHVQDSSSLEQSGSYSHSYTSITQTTQGYESRIFSNEMYNSNDDRRRVKRTLSGYSDKTTSSGVGGQSPSVLVVQESRSDHILNTVDGNDRMNDDDEYSMSGFDLESAAENSPDDTSNVITNQSDTTNRNNFESCKDLPTAEEEMQFDHDDHQQRFRSQTYYKQSIQMSSANNIQTVKPSEDTQPHSEKIPVENLSSSYAEVPFGNNERNESDYIHPNGERKLYNSTDYLDRTDSVEHSYFASFHSAGKPMKEFGKISNAENRDSQIDKNVSEKSNESCYIQMSLMAKAGNLSQNAGNVSQNDDVKESHKTENEQSFEFSANEENEMSNKGAESKLLGSNAMTNDKAVSLSYMHNDRQEVEIHGDLLQNKSPLDESINENRTQQCQNQNDSGVESQEMDMGKCVSQPEVQTMSYDYEPKQSYNDMGEVGKASAPESSQTTSHLEQSNEPNEIISNSVAEEKDATPKIKPENIKTEVGKEKPFHVDTSESSHEYNIFEDDRGIIYNPDQRVNGDAFEENDVKSKFTVERTSSSRKDNDNVVEHSVNADNDNAPYAIPTSTSEQEDNTENSLKLNLITPDADEKPERSDITTTSTTEINQCIDSDVDNIMINDSPLLEQEESSEESYQQTKSELERDSESSKMVHKDKDVIKANTGNEDAVNEGEPLGLFDEPFVQEIERDAPRDEERNQENESDTALNLIARTSVSAKGSEDSDSISEMQEESGKRGDVDKGIVRISKSSSTLSVKTASSSSSRISSSTHHSKEENKKLERLLKGPYSEKPTTPRLKGRQKNESDKRKLIKSQEKPKSKPISSGKKHGVPKLQIHKTTKNVNDKQMPNSKKSKATTPASKEKGEKEKKSTLPVKLDERITNETIESNSVIVNQRSIYHIKEVDTEAEGTVAVTEQNLSKPANEHLKVPDSSTKNVPSARGEAKQEEPNNEQKEMCSDDNSLGTKRSNSVTVKETEQSEENNSISSENGKPMSPGASNKNTEENKSFLQSLLLGKKKIIISSPKTSERLSAKEAKKATPLKSNGNNKNMSPITVPKRSNHETNRPLTAPITNKGNTKSADPAMKATTITVIDETEDNLKTSPTAGRFILNNIKINLKKKSLQNNASSKISRGRSRSPSPEGNGLNSSGPQKDGKPAYKTQSMSSLQVPGQTSAPNSWDPPKEEDALSTYSRRPSMDSVSRKSVDYRIRNTTTVIQPQGEEKPKSVFNNDETFIQNAVPCLPLGLAITCLFLNTVLPGSGTALSGISILCCGRSRLSNKEDQVLNTMCANLIVGLAQLFTVSFLLVGWFWSVGWGIKMVSLSVKRRQEIKQQREKDLQTLALSAFGSPKRLNGFGV